MTIHHLSLDSGPALSKNFVSFKRWGARLSFDLRFGGLLRSELLAAKSLLTSCQLQEKNGMREYLV